MMRSTMQLCTLCLLLMAGNIRAETNLLKNQIIHHTGDMLRGENDQDDQIIHNIRDMLRGENDQIIHYAEDEDEDEDEEDLKRRELNDFYPKGPNQTSHKKLLGALQEVLEKLQTKKSPSWEKKLGQVPTCDVGEQCAVRKGSRIGRMCDCPRGAFCNLYLLKCL